MRYITDVLIYYAEQKKPAKIYIKIKNIDLKYIKFTPNWIENNDTNVWLTQFRVILGHAYVLLVFLLFIIAKRSNEHKTGEY